MATVSESNANFVQGLSDLWIRFFKDKPTLEALYSGVEIPIGQAYLDLLSNVLNISVREAPIFRKEFFKLLVVREDLVIFDPTTATYKFELTNLNIRDFKFLYNKIFAPTVVLEKQVDFTIEVGKPVGEIKTESEMSEETDIDYLTFVRNPFDWENDGLPIPGVAYRTVDVAQDDGTVTRERELAFWVPDAQVDAYDLYLNYGYLLNYFAPSSESYRALLQGIIQYFVLGPTPQHLTSALNIILGLPLVRDDGEILQSIDTSDSLYQIVKTNRANYQFGAAIPLRTDILDESNWGTLTFKAFEHLSDMFRVHDSVSNPAWFYDSTIPLQILPDEPRARRNIYPGLWENRINVPEGLLRIGDPGFIVGRDDDGGIPTGDRLPLRHSFSYIVFERFLRHHVFMVEFAPDAVMSGVVPFPRFVRDLLNIIIPGKSAYTFLLVEPALTPTDILHLYAEQMSIQGQLTGDVALFGGVPNQLRIGDTRYPWQVGDYYTYESDDITVGHWPIGNRFENGKTPFVLGGVDPTNRGGLVTEKLTGGYFGVRNGVPYLEHKTFSWEGPALTDTDVGRYIYRPRNGTWFRIIDLETTIIPGLPTYIKVTATLDAIPIPVTPLGGERWALYGTPTKDQITDWAAQIKQIGGFPTKDIWGGGLLSGTLSPYTPSPNNAAAGLLTRYDGYRWTDEFPNEKRADIFWNLWGTATNEIWAVGVREKRDGIDDDLLSQEGVVYFWNGETWRQKLFRPRERPGSAGIAVGGSSVTDVWVGITEGELSHWDGSDWTHYTISDFLCASIWAATSDNVYAAGADIVSDEPELWHWDGTTWAQVMVGEEPGESSFKTVFGFGANDVWVVGNMYGIYHWNGTSWTNTLNTPFARNSSQALHGVATNDVWLIGDNLVYRWNGTTWSQDASAVFDGTYWGVWARAANEVYAWSLDETSSDETYTRIYLWDGSTWNVFRNLTYPGEIIFGLWGI